MVALTERVQRRLTVEKVEIAPETTAIRCLDWDRDRFDIEFGLKNGTTYNSFIIRGEKTASSIPRTRSFASNTWTF